MPVDDLWYLAKRGPDGARLPSKRHSRGKRWRVRWTDDRGESRAALFDRKADAERHDANVRADLSRGVYVDDRGRRLLERFTPAGANRHERHGRIGRRQEIHDEPGDEIRVFEREGV